jgi:hypothetical protein
MQDEIVGMTGYPADLVLQDLYLCLWGAETLS